MANILIVEDEKNMQEIIAEYMRRGGHVCYTADDGVDALMVLKNNPMDLMMQHLMYGAANQEDGVVFYFSIPAVK